MSLQVFENDSLVSSQRIPLGTVVTIASGQNLKRGAVLGRITATDKYVLSLAAAEDGSQEADVILAEDVNATGGDKNAFVYTAGTFVDKALIFGTGQSVASSWRPLRAKSIHIVKGV
jgi:hypothetical protein